MYNVGLTKQNQRAITSLITTGDLPTNPHWSSLRDQYKVDPKAFTKEKPLLGTLFRNENSDRGILAGLPALKHVNERISANGFAVFAKHHPFLARLLKVKLPAGEIVNPGIPIVPVTPSVPEPSSALMMGSAIVVIFLGLRLRRNP